MREVPDQARVLAPTNRPGSVLNKQLQTADTYTSTATCCFAASDRAAATRVPGPWGAFTANHQPWTLQRPWQIACPSTVRLVHSRDDRIARSHAGMLTPPTLDMPQAMGAGRVVSGNVG